MWGDAKEVENVDGKLCWGRTSGRVGICCDGK